MSLWGWLWLQISGFVMLVVWLCCSAGNNKTMWRRKGEFQDANSKSKSPGEFALEWREFWMAKDKQQAFIFIGFLNLFRMKWLRHCKRNHGRDLHYELDSMQYNYVLFILYYKTDILSFNSFVKLLTSRGNGAFKLLAYNELIRRYQQIKCKMSNALQEWYPLYCHVITRFGGAYPAT